MPRAKPKYKAKRLPASLLPEVIANLPVRPQGRRPILTPDPETIGKIEGAASLMATDEEIAWVLGVHPSTFAEFRKKYPEVQDALEKGQHLGRLSLRRQQFEIAKKGNVAMQKHLGVNYLGQRSAPELIGKGDQGGMTLNGRIGPREFTLTIFDGGPGSAAQEDFDGPTIDGEATEE